MARSEAYLPPATVIKNECLNAARRKARRTQHVVIFQSRQPRLNQRRPTKQSSARHQVMKCFIAGFREGFGIVAHTRMAIVSGQRLNRRMKNVGMKAAEVPRACSSTTTIRRLSRRRLPYDAYFNIEDDEERRVALHANASPSTQQVLWSRLY